MNSENKASTGDTEPNLDIGSPKAVLPLVISKMEAASIALVVQTALCVYFDADWKLTAISILGTIFLGWYSLSRRHSDH